MTSDFCLEQLCSGTIYWNEEKWGDRILKWKVRFWLDKIFYIYKFKVPVRNPRVHIKWAAEYMSMVFRRKVLTEMLWGGTLADWWPLKSGVGLKPRKRTNEEASSRDRRRGLPGPRKAWRKWGSRCRKLRWGGVASIRGYPQAEKMQTNRRRLGLAVRETPGPEAAVSTAQRGQKPDCTHRQFANTWNLFWASKVLKVKHPYLSFFISYSPVEIFTF